MKVEAGRVYVTNDNRIAPLVRIFPSEQGGKFYLEGQYQSFGGIGIDFFLENGAGLLRDWKLVREAGTLEIELLGCV